WRMFCWRFWRAQTPLNGRHPSKARLEPSSKVTFQRQTRSQCGTASQNSRKRTNLERRSELRRSSTNRSREESEQISSRKSQIVAVVSDVSGVAASALSAHRVAPRLLRASSGPAFSEEKLPAPPDLEPAGLGVHFHE